jgi:hypothetical protein
VALDSETVTAMAQHPEWWETAGPLHPDAVQAVWYDLVRPRTITRFTAVVHGRSVTLSGLPGIFRSADGQSRIWGQDEAGQTVDVTVAKDDVQIYIGLWDETRDLSGS